MKREKPLYFILFFIYSICLLNPIISYAQDLDNENLGKIRGWIIDPETGEPAGERFRIELIDINSSGPWRSYRRHFTSNAIGYFEGVIIPGTYYLSILTDALSSKYSSREPNPFKSKDYRTVVHIEEGKILEVRKKATIGGRLEILIVDHDGKVIDLKSEFNVPNIYAKARIKNSNLRSEFVIRGLDRDDLTDGEMISHAIFPGIYKVYLYLFGIGHEDALLSADGVGVISGTTTTVKFQLDNTNCTGVDGYVYNKKGSIIPDIEINFIHKFRKPGRTGDLITFTNKNGYYRFVGLEEGVYEIIIFTIGAPNIRKTINIKKDKILRENIFIDSADY